MSRLTGPDESCRTVFLTSGPNAGKAAAQGMSAPLYADAALTTPADVRSTTGDVIAGTPPTVLVDAYSQLPLIQYPDGVDTIYTSINGGPAVALYARTDDRLDGLAVRVTALEPGGDDEAATAADLAGHAADTTNVHGIADTAVLETVSGAQAKATTAQNAAVSAAATDATAKAASAQAAAISAAATDATTKAAAAQAAAVAAAATDATTRANAAQAAATTAAATDATTKANAAQAAAVTAAATDATTKANAAQAGAVASSRQKPSTARLRWYQAAGSALYRPVPVVAIGSSTTSGQGSTTAARRVVNLLADRLKAVFNPTTVPGGMGVRAYDSVTGSGWTVSGTTTVTNQGLGYTIRDFGVGDYAERQFLGTSVSVFFKQGPSRGQFSVTIDGGAATTVTPDATGTDNRSDGVWTSPGLTRGTHTVRITGVSAGARIEGVYCYDGDEAAGVQVHNGGLGGITTDQLGYNTSLITRLNQLKPMLLLVQQHGNDYLNQGTTPIATTESNLRAFIAAVGAGVSPVPTIVLVHPHKPLTLSSPTASWDQYRTLLTTIAADNPATVDVLDLSGVWPVSQAADVWDVLHSDDLHLTDYGHAVAAERLGDELAPTPPARAVSTSSGGSSASADVQQFTASGTWTKPANAVMVEVELIGGGGGGGAGRRGAAGTVRCGGGGGGGAGITRLLIPAAALPSTVTVTVGAGGAGGAATTANDTSGANGSTGTATTFGTYARAGTAGGGGGGTAAAGTSGTAGTGTTTGTSGGAASATGAAGAAATIFTTAGGGGGSGGGITAGDAASAGGAGGGSHSTTTAAGGVVDSTAPSAGSDQPANSTIPAGGGGGGASSVTGAGQTGAAGGRYGGGGGGGGASVNGNNAGGGGAGGPGIATVVTHF